MAHLETIQDQLHHVLKIHILEFIRFYKYFYHIFFFLAFQCDLECFNLAFERKELLKFVHFGSIT